MSSPQINQLILDKLDAQEAAPHVKGFIREILQHEKGSLEQERAPYTRAYENLLNRYAQEQKKSK